MSDMSFDGKSALSYWGLELIQCLVTAPQRKTYWIDIPAGDGKLDAMRGLGEPVYEMRTLTAVFKIDSIQRQRTVSRILCELEGREVKILSPDDLNFYWFGEPHLKNSGATSVDEITIEATVYPWKYAVNEMTIRVPASASPVTYTWYNGGMRTVVPELEVVDAAVEISVGDFSTIITAGIYNLSEFKIPGNSTISVRISGGSLIARYREARLL